MSASQANLAWTQVSAAQHTEGRSSDGNGYDGGPYHMGSNQNIDSSYPRKVVEVRQEYQYV